MLVLLGLGCVDASDPSSRLLSRTPSARPPELPCAELAATWVDGVASAREDGTWDVSGCVRSDLDAEVVTPAARDPSRWSGARCNDGTPYVFAVRLADPDAPWVVYLEGGHQCDDLSIRCEDRDPNLTSSSEWADRGAGTLDGFGGLLSRDPAVNPDFADANQVWGRYCSSDAWRGTRGASVATTAGPTWFTGVWNFRALLDVLRSRYGLDDGERVLLAGGSAGGSGAFTNAWYAAERLPESAAAGDLRVFLDAGWTPRWDDPDHRVGRSGLSWDELYAPRAELWGVSPDPACLAAGADELTCSFAVGEAAVVPVPWLLQQSSLDREGLRLVHVDEDDLEARAAWQALFYAETADAEWLFSSSEPTHQLALEDASWASGPPGAALREVVGRFWRGGAPERVVY